METINGLVVAPSREFYLPAWWLATDGLHAILRNGERKALAKHPHTK